jgi:hypothetical protein
MDIVRGYLANDMKRPLLARRNTLGPILGPELFGNVVRVNLRTLALHARWQSPQQVVWVFNKMAGVNYFV